MEFFFGLEKAGVVTVRGDAQVVLRFDAVVANVLRREQEKGHAPYPLAWQDCIR